MMKHNNIHRYIHFFKNKTVIEAKVDFSEETVRIQFNADDYSKKHFDKIEYEKWWNFYLVPKIISTMKPKQLIKYYANL